MTCISMRARSGAAHLRVWLPGDPLEASNVISEALKRWRREGDREEKPVASSGVLGSQLPC